MGNDDGCGGGGGLVLLLLLCLRLFYFVALWVDGSPLEV